MLERELGTHTPIGIQYLISEWKEVLEMRNEHTLAAQYNIVLLHCSFAQCSSLRVCFVSYNCVVAQCLLLRVDSTLLIRVSM